MGIAGIAQSLGHELSDLTAPISTAAAAVKYILVIVLFLWVSTGSIRIIYNLHFHPLARFPGPRTRAAFYWPLHWEQYTGRAPQNTHELHEKYGPVVRIGPDRLSFISSRAYKDIYGFRSDRSQIPKDHKRFPIGTAHLETLIGSNDADHGRIRRVIAHALSETGLREQEALIQGHFSNFIESLQNIAAKPSHQVNLDNWADWISFDILSDLVYGKSFDCVRNQANHGFINEIYKGCHVLPAVLMAWDYGLLHWLMKNLVLSKRVRNAWDGKSAALKSDFGMAKTRLPLRRTPSQPCPLTPPENHGLSLILMAAGGEEPASTIAGAMHYLLTNPTKLRRLQAELDATYPTSQDITFARLGESPYLQAVVKETLRIRPPPAGHLARRTEGGMVVDGWVVPRGTAIEVPLFASGRSPLNWADPNSFIPERWLPDAPARFCADDKEAWQPFMMGPRGCVGKNLAMIIIRGTLVRLLWHFDVALVDERRDWLQGQVFRMVWHRPGLMVRLTPRRGGEGV